MRIIYLVKVFTANKNEGNPAGVILNADNVSETQMQEIASSLRFSESAFICPSQKADFKVRFFSPTKEVNLCVHATLAAVYILRKIKKTERSALSIETKAGIFPIRYDRSGMITMEFPKTKFMNAKMKEQEIVSLLGITNQDLLPHPLQIVSIGSPKLIIPVKSLSILFQIKPNLEGIKKWCRKNGISGFYPFTTETKEKGSDFHARQFNPLAGINEDPITGIAAGALGAYAVKHKISKKRKFIVEQGYIMKKPGKVFVGVKDNVKVGGRVVLFGIRKAKP